MEKTKKNKDAVIMIRANKELKESIVAWAQSKGLGLSAAMRMITLERLAAERKEK